MSRLIKSSEDGETIKKIKIIKNTGMIYGGGGGGINFFGILAENKY